MRFNAHAIGGIKNLKGATELELNFIIRRHIKWAVTNTLPPFRNRPGPQRQHAPRPPAAGGRLDLPDTAPLGNQVEAGAAICALMSTRRPEHTTSHVRIVAGKSGTQSRIRVPY